MVSYYKIKENADVEKVNMLLIFFFFYFIIFPNVQGHKLLNAVLYVVEMNKYE